jgi:hypothetical protein
MRSTFGIPIGIIIMVDETGRNLGGCWFDINATDKGKRIIYFVAEVKSHWAEKGNLEADFDKTKDELRSHMNKTMSVLLKEGKDGKMWIFPDYGYAFSINVLSNKIEIFIRKFDFNKVDQEGKKGDWVEW